MSPFRISATSLLLAIDLASASAIAKRESSNPLQQRSVQVGWSLQASTCPAGSTSCGNGACCPSSLYCNAAATDEVSACCSTTSDCRGTIEGSPACADSSWSLWSGYQGNDFCCLIGMVGTYDYHNLVAGTCVSSAAAVSATTAALKSTGSGAAVTSASTSVSQVTTASTTSIATTTSTTSKTTTSTSVSTRSTVSAGATGKPVFFHYMIGYITDAHCEQDIKDAMALGADAFALNLNTDDPVNDSWATNTVISLFNWANTLGFKLFFSFDMTGFSNPDQFTSYLLSYVTNDAYYKYDGLPLVSTFNGGASSYTFGQGSVNDGWKVEFQNVMSAAGYPIYFVPAFQDVAASSDFFTTEFPTVNGAMNWNSWPFNTEGDIIVPTTDDITYLDCAHAAGKTFLMGVSPLQFKHMDSGDNWYRRGEDNLEYRFGQVLNLQPDFIELQTWNDAGESHYMGNSWEEPISGTAILGYTEDYDHTGYWQILESFIKVFKSGATTTATMYPTNGASAQGTFWHHTLTLNGDCSSDSLGKPTGYTTVEDKVTAVVLVAAGTTGYSVSITSGSTTLGTSALVAGFNTYSVNNITAGTIGVTVTNSAGATVISGTGPIAVATSASLCNYNFQVVGLA